MLAIRNQADTQEVIGLRKIRARHPQESALLLQISIENCEGNITITEPTKIIKIIEKTSEGFFSLKYFNLILPP